MKRKSPTQTREYALEQLKEYKELGSDNVPFYMWPYLDMVKIKGKVEADRIVGDYERIHHSTPCVRDGCLMLSYKKFKHQKENENTE